MQYVKQVRYFQATTPAAQQAAIAAGHHTLMLAPTGSGKTLAAFLYCLDRLAHEPDLAREVGAHFIVKGLRAIAPPRLATST